MTPPRALPVIGPSHSQRASLITETRISRSPVSPPRSRGPHSFLREPGGQKTVARFFQRGTQPSCRRNICDPPVPASGPPIQCDGISRWGLWEEIARKEGGGSLRKRPRGLPTPSALRQRPAADPGAPRSQPSFQSWEKQAALVYKPPGLWTEPPKRFQVKSFSSLHLTWVALKLKAPTRQLCKSTPIHIY